MSQTNPKYKWHSTLLALFIALSLLIAPLAPLDTVPAVPTHSVETAATSLIDLYNNRLTAQPAAAQAGIVYGTRGGGGTDFGYFDSGWNWNPVNTLAPADEATIFAQIQADQQSFRLDKATGNWQAPHLGQGYATAIQADGSMVTQPHNKPWTWGLRLHSIARGDHEQTFAHTTPVQSSHGQRLTQAWSETVDEWFHNEGNALEHGFTLHERPFSNQFSVNSEQWSVFGDRYSLSEAMVNEQIVNRQSQIVNVTLDLLTEFTPIIDGDTVRFVDASGATQLRYAKLYVFDANGQEVPSEFALTKRAGRNQIAIAVDDSQATYPLTIDPAVFIQLQKLLPSDGVAVDLFSQSAVALDGDTALIGAFGDDDNGNQSGAAYIFTRSGRTWTQKQKLLPNDGPSNASFGLGVALAGDVAFIGASTDDSLLFDAGAVYVFTRSGSTWTQQQKLTASDAFPQARFGQTIAIDGDTALIGAALDGNLGSFVGAAYVFTWNGTTWSEQAKLTASDWATSDGFGYSVALSGDTALVGAWRDDDNGSESGSAYVFTRSGTTWTEQQKLAPADTTASDEFGYAVAVEGDMALVGTNRGGNGGIRTGSVYVYTRSGSTWTQQQKLVPSDGVANDRFGTAIDMDGDIAIIGAYQVDDNGLNAGAAYVFARSGSTWTEERKLLASDGANSDSFGQSVAVDGDTALISSPLDDDLGNVSGAAYIFQLASGIIVGTAFVDANMNGQKDAPESILPNVTVTAIDANGTTASTVTTASGTYLIDVNLAGLTGKVRLEFALPADGSLDHLQPSIWGAQNGTTVQFVYANPAGVTVANVAYNAADPLSNCIEPTVALSCLGPGAGNGSAGWVSYDSASGSPRSVNQDATSQEIGSVWGTAVDVPSGYVYSAAYLRRHSDLGPLAAAAGAVDGVYRVAYVNGVATFDGANPGFTLQGVTPANGQPVIDLGTVNRVADTNMVLDNNYELLSGNPQSVDLDAFANAGKVGYGNIDLNPADGSLWLVNLNQKSLIRVDIADPSMTFNGGPAPAGLVTTTPISDPGCGGNHRPWAATIYNGVGYLGIACEDASNAYVRSFDPAAPATQTTAMTIPLGYAREEIFRSDFGTVPDATWQGWSDTYQSVPVQDGRLFLGGAPAAYPQPIFSDIDFDLDGNMAVGLMDRWGVQMRNLNLEAKPLSQNPQIVRTASAGDLIRVCNVAGAWVLEGDTGCTDSVDTGGVTSTIAGGVNAPDQSEFYHNDENATCTYHTFFWETFTGGACVSSGNLIATVLGGPNEGGFVKSGDIWNQGIRTYSNSDGGIFDANPIDDSLSCFADTTNSLGEPACLCLLPPTEVGNRVWNDYNGNGIQEPCEPGIGGVTVELIDSSNAMIASAVTDARGEYYFNSGTGTDSANAKYGLAIPPSGVKVRIVNAIGGSQQAALSGLVLSAADQADANAVIDDQVDSDATLNVNAAEIVVETTGGRVDHTYDFGFRAPTADLALRKTTPVQYANTGSSVTFEIEVFNQGTSAVDTIELTDYIPVNLTLNDANWTASGTGVGPDTATRTLTSGNGLPVCGLLPGESVTVQITFDIAAALADNTVITNEVEISSMSAPDSDSTPDNTQGNETGSVNDIIDNSGGDEDDADVATITVTSQAVYDLALRKQVAHSQPTTVNEGDDVIFSIELFNQGTVDATSITLVDTYPTGFSLSTNNSYNWVDSGGTSATINLTNTLLAGTSTIVDIVLTAGSTLGLQTNTAEISADDGADGDSTPGGGANNLVDDAINDDGTNDEDDHDIATVTVRRFDLSLTKSLAAYEPTTAVVGADVDFVVQVTNEGSVDAYDISVTDVLTTGLELSPNDVGGWSEENGAVHGVIPGPIAPGDSAALTVTLRISDTAALGVLTNCAHIRRATDEPIGPEVADLDSTLNNGCVGEDDDDTADITVGAFDLALRKTFVSDSSADGITNDAQLGPGERITFTLTVFNQGVVDAYDVRLTDVNPDGIILDDSDPALNYDNGWRVENMTLNHVVLPGPIAANGGQASIDIVLTAIGPNSILYPAGGILGPQTNHAEISSAANEPGGPPVADVDSTPDEDNTNDGAITDDEITQDGKNGGDEDDHDIEPFTIVNTYDLALRKYPQSKYTPGYVIPILQPGQTIVYEYEIVNQGLAMVEDIVVVDYVPVGFTLSDANWSPNPLVGPGNSQRTHTGINLAPGDSMTGTVMLVADTNLTNGQIYTNTMEIADMRVGGATVVDSDSTPDTDPNNDLVVQDNMLRGNARLAATTQDEDDHDIALMMANFVSLGNRVWADADGDGMLNNGELGIADVELQLLNGDGSDYDMDAVTAGTQVYNVTTDASGYYTFTPLASGSYRVRVTAANFNVGGALTGSNSTNDVAETNTPDGDVDNDDNGPGTASGLVESGVVMLTLGAEPTGELHVGTTDVSTNTNYTVDFGFSPPIPLDFEIAKWVNTPTTVTVGSQVSFTIRITNTGSVTITNLPLTDTYDTDYLTYNTAADLVSPNPASEAADDGNILWNNVIDFDGDNRLAPQETLDIIVWFIAKAETTNLLGGTECESAGYTHNKASALGIESCVEVPIDPGEAKLPLGDLVWHDINGDGNQDANEPGIDGVLVNLYELDGTFTRLPSSLITTTTTTTGTGGSAISGFYEFTVISGKNYEIEIDASNFAAGGPLEGFIIASDQNDNQLLTIGDTVSNRIVPNLTTPNASQDFGYYCAFDLALDKKLAGGQPASIVAGEDVTFTLTIYNQGTVTATNVTIADYIPIGFTLNDGNWNGGPTGTVTQTLAATLTPSGTVGSSATMDIILTAGPTLSGTYTNTAEIITYTSALVDGNGNPLPDVDSTPDDTDGNEPGETTNLVDDELNQDGKNGGDEDDHDPAVITVAPLNPSVAVNKQFNGVGDVRVGETISFTIRITNTGDVTITSLPLEDRYSDAFLTYDSASILPDPGSGSGILTWTDLLSGDPNGLAISETVSVDVFFTTAADTTLLSAVAPCTESGHAPNLVRSVGAMAGATPVIEDADDTSCDSVEILNPTAVALAGRSVTQTPDGVQVRWSTESESDIAGFYILKSNGVESEMRSPDMIVAQKSGQSSGASYTWLDAGALFSPGDAYLLEVIYVDGSSERTVLDVVAARAIYMPLIVQ